MGGHIGVAHKHSCQVQTTPQGGSFFDLNTRARGVASVTIVIWTLVRHARSPAACDDGSRTAHRRSLRPRPSASAPNHPKRIRNQDDDCGRAPSGTGGSAQI